MIATRQELVCAKLNLLRWFSLFLLLYLILFRDRLRKIVFFSLNKTFFFSCSILIHLDGLHVLLHDFLIFLHVFWSLLDLVVFLAQFLDWCQFFGIWLSDCQLDLAKVNLIVRLYVSMHTYVYALGYILDKDIPEDRFRRR